MSETPFRNRLFQESSPYLRQHAKNPVNWYPWGAEALALARTADRPIFLSIGYSACHWCHVMEHESFENPEVAQLLNEHFVSIKVDREERPDLDQIYMASVQILTGQGGWPMSVFLTPDLKPFTGGTYFPPDDRYGRPGFKCVLRMVADWWQNRRGDVKEAANQITEQIRTVGQLPPPGKRSELSADQLLRSFDALARSYDPIHGGFGAAPKFPHPMDIRLLFRIWQRFDNTQALAMARHTLEKMAMGGIYDHLGGGFARYSTDARWLVPHFEKMLYDNALLVPCYLEAYQITDDLFFRDVAEETLAWVQREMISPEGAFYSTLDADSEGIEGKFYVWKAAEIDQLLGDDAALFRSVYGVDDTGNWNESASHGLHNVTILNRSKTWSQSARLDHIEEAELRQRLGKCRAILFEARAKRVRPGLDDKALTSWNGLMIGAFAQAAIVLDRPEFATCASCAAEFILSKMRTSNGRLLRTWSHGHVAKLNGYLEDYSYLIDGLFTLYEASFEVRWLREAVNLADVMVEQFWDNNGGGFFFTGKDHESLIARGKDPHDNATPSGNAMAVTALLRLVKLTGRDDFWEKAEMTLGLYRELMAGHPSAAGQMLLALDFSLGPVDEIAIVGARDEEDAHRAIRAVRKGYRPKQVVAFKDSARIDEDEQIALLANKKGGTGVVTYICRDFTCAAPLLGGASVEEALKATARR